MWGVRKIEMADKGRGVMAGVVASGRMSRFLGLNGRKCGAIRQEAVKEEK